MSLPSAFPNDLGSIVGGRNLLQGLEDLIPCGFAGIAALKEKAGAVALRFAGRLLRFYQRSGGQTVACKLRLTRLLPARLRSLERQTPTIAPHCSGQLITPVEKPVVKQRYRVALLIGCGRTWFFQISIAIRAAICKSLADCALLELNLKSCNRSYFLPELVEKKIMPKTRQELTKQNSLSCTSYDTPFN